MAHVLASGDLTLASVNEDPSFNEAAFSVNSLIFLVIFSHSCYMGIQYSVPQGPGQQYHL